MAYNKKSASLGKNEVHIDIGKNKQVSVRQFNGINLVDIREYYKDKESGEMRPGKKGISLTEESWDLLVSNQKNIQRALNQLKGEVDDEDKEDDEEEEAKPAVKKRKLEEDEDEEE